MPDRPLDTIDFPPPRRGRRRVGLLSVVLVLAVLFSAGTALSYYVEALWFGSLGYGDVFWKTLNIQSAVFALAGVMTFAALYGAFRMLKPPRFGELGTDGFLIINNRPVKLPVGPVLSLVAIVVSTLIAFGTAAAMAADWPTLALCWSARDAALPAAARTVDPIFGRPLAFYLFALPAWQLFAGWALRLAFLIFAMGLFFFATSGSGRVLRRGRPDAGHFGRQLGGSRRETRGLAGA